MLCGRVICICAEVLQLLSLLHLLHPLAAEVLKISETAIVLYVIDHRCQILLLIRRSNSLVHYI